MIKMKSIIKESRMNMIKESRMNPPSSSYQRRGYYQRSTSNRYSRNTTQSNPRRGNPLFYRGNVSRFWVCQSILHWEKDSVQIKILVKLLYTSQSYTQKKHYNNLLVRPSTQLF